MAEPSPAEAVRLEADAQRPGEMDPDSKSVSRNQWEEPIDLSLPHTLTIMSVSFLHPAASGDEGRKNEEGEENLWDCFNPEETNFFSSGSFPPSCKPSTKQDGLTPSELQ